MYIYLDTSLLPFGEGDHFSLINLALASREGKHVVTGDRRVLRNIAETRELGNAVTAEYRRLYNSSTRWSGLSSHLAITARVVRDPSCPATHADRRELLVSLGQFSLPTSQDTVLLCENELDGRLYQLVGEVYLCRRRELRGLQVQCRVRGGGGSTTSGHLSSISGEFFLCIVDSDRRHPTDSIGRTAEDAQAAFAAASPRLGELYVLPLRAAENLLPYRVVEELSSIDATSRDRFRALAQSDCAQLLFFANLKKGMLLSEALRLPHRSPQRVFWMSMASKATSNMHGCAKACLASASCADEEACSCWLVPRLGERALRHAVTYLEYGSSRKAAEAVSGHVEEAWEHLGSVVAAWCCAATPHRAL